MPRHATRTSKKTEDPTQGKEGRGERKEREREREGRSWEANLWGQAKQAARAPTCTCNMNPDRTAHARRSASRKQNETMPGNKQERGDARAMHKTTQARHDREAKQTNKRKTAYKRK